MKLDEVAEQAISQLGAGAALFIAVLAVLSAALPALLA